MPQVIGIIILALVVYFGFNLLAPVLVWAVATISGVVTFLLTRVLLFSIIVAALILWIF
jgi:hypothetical protein